MSWRLVFPKATIQHLGAINSDHSSILLDTQPTNHYLPRPFRFEAAWTRDTKCFGIIAEAWKEEVEGSDFLKLCMKQLNTQLALKKWNKDVIGHCQRRIDVLLAKIQEIQKQDCTEENCRKEAHLQADLNEWLLRNEILWKQKSREVWLKEGDKNSKFFHLSTIIRRRRNSIDAVKNDSGEWITDRREIQKHFVEKFKTLFNEEEEEFPKNLENLITPCITEKENMELCRIPIQSEIKQKLFQLQSLKALGPDGFPVLFYKKYWAIVGESVTRAITSFFQAGRMPDEVNNSFIVLIPKSQSPTSFNHYRPISLCNIVYKIITKLLVSRLRNILHKLISPTQATFIPGRWIAKNQVIVHEMLHSFKTRKVKYGLMAIKIDLQKAYDRVNWNFLQAVLKNFGFD